MYNIGGQAPDPGGRRSRGRLWTALGLLAVLGFVVAVVGSAGRSAVSTGGTGGMSGMEMGDRQMVAVDARDIDGQEVKLPGGRGGAVVVIQSRGCVPCRRSVRRMVAAAKRVPTPVSLTALSAEADDDRASVHRFAASVGRPALRYLVDDRNSTLATMLGVTQLGSIVVYDVQGHVVDARTDSVAGLAAGLRRASSAS